MKTPQFRLPKLQNIKFKQKFKTYVPPTPPALSDEMVEKGSSQTATEAPKLAAKREARTPPLPAPIVKRSKSYGRRASTPFSDWDRTTMPRRQWRRLLVRGRKRWQRGRGDKGLGIERKEEDREMGRFLQKRVWRVCEEEREVAIFGLYKMPALWFSSWVCSLCSTMVENRLNFRLFEKKMGFFFSSNELGFG